MDNPNTALIVQRSLCEQLNAALAANNANEVAKLTPQLIGITEALDDWLMGGGYLPDDWLRRRTNA